jgi:hypothetical protein
MSRQRTFRKRQLLRAHEEWMYRIARYSSKQTIGVPVGPALPGTVRITKVDLHIGRHREALMSGQLVAPIPGQRAS